MSIIFFVSRVLLLFMRFSLPFMSLSLFDQNIVYKIVLPIFKARVQSHLRMHKNWLIYLLPGPTNIYNNTLLSLLQSQCEFINICTMSDIGISRDALSIKPSSSGASIDEYERKQKKNYRLGGEQFECICLKRLLDGGI